MTLQNMAFAGLDQSQYHLFARSAYWSWRLKTYPRFSSLELHLQSENHSILRPLVMQKHFDSLRDYFRHKISMVTPRWSAFGEFHTGAQSCSQTQCTSKKNGKRRVEALTKKQFCKTVDNYVKTLLKTQTAKNRADIVKCIKQLQGVKSDEAK